MQMLLSLLCFIIFFFAVVIELAHLTLNSQRVQFSLANSHRLLEWDVCVRVSVSSMRFTLFALLELV